MAENGKVLELSAKQKRAIAALLTAGNVRGASKIAHVGERTLFRWMGEECFARALQQAGDDALAATVRALTDAGTVAVLTLRGIMARPGAKDSDKRGAADAILSHMLRVRELAEIERRLAVLEGLQNGKSKRST